jgi:hypothetical protein
MFVVSDVEAAAIRTAFEQRGELAAAVELRRLFPGITDTAKARACARTIAGGKPLPVMPTRPVARLRPRGGLRKKEGEGSALDPLGPEAPDPHH